MTSLIPLYVKTTYKNDPTFQNAKTVFTVHDTKFNHVFGDDLLEKVKMIDIEDGMLDLLKTANFEGFIKIGMQYADATSNADGQASASFKALIKSLSEGNDISDIKQDENFEESYYKLYNELIG
jgi:starch synthase